MKVLERIGRLVRADAHGVMDLIEERSLLLKQHLREAEIEVAQKRALLQGLEDTLSRVKEEGQRIEARVAERDADVELALENEDAELARFAIRRLLPEREALKELLVEALRLEERRDQLREVLDRQEAQLADLRARVRAELARPVRSASRDDDLPDLSSVHEEEVELELLRRRDRGEASYADPEVSA